MIASLELLVTLLRKAAQIAGGSLESATHLALEQVSKLGVGDFAVLPGGWSTGGGGHRYR